MGGRSPRLPGRRPGREVGFGLALLALSHAGAAQATGYELYQRVVDAADDAEFGAEEVATLERILAELELVPADSEVPMARFAAELCLRAGVGEDLGPDTLESLGEVEEGARRWWPVLGLAGAHLQAGRLAVADALVRFGLENPEITRLGGWSRLWLLRAEIARLGGRWDEAEECLAALESSLPARAACACDEDHELYSRLLQARCQVLLELGLMDRCQELASAALEEADASREPSAMVAARLLAIDLALMTSDAAHAAALVQAGLADAWLAPYQALFRLPEGRAELERAREAAPESAQRSEAGARARAALAAALCAQLSRADELKAALSACDLELLLGDLAAAREHLQHAHELTTGPGRVAETSESMQLAVLAWQVACEGAGARDTERGALLAAYGRFLAQWRATPRRPGGIGFLHLAWRAQVLSEVIQAELEETPGEEGRRRAFARLMEAQAMGTRARALELVAPTIEAVQARLLAPRRGLLVLLPARDRSHLFVLAGEDVEHHTLALGRDVLRERARQVTAALFRADGEVGREPLRALHEALVPAAVRARMESWSEAVTVGFDALSGLSFGILGGEDGRPYAQRLALATLPSVALWAELASRLAPAPAAHDLVLVAAEGAGRIGQPLLRFGAEEKARLVKPFAPGRVMVLEDEAACLKTLLAAHALSGARVTHFLAHGTQLPGRESSAALVLRRCGEGDDGLLCAEEVAALEPEGLVILSACGSGHGPLRTGDDTLVSLGGAFLDAGARCVVQSRFPVEYEATLALMERFHARLAQGDSPAEALRAARSAGAGAGRDGLAAYQAASFEVLGLGFEPVFARTSGQ